MTTTLKVMGIITLVISITSIIMYFVTGDVSFNYCGILILGFGLLFISESEKKVEIREVNQK